jgi:hypothetical protein
VISHGPRDLIVYDNACNKLPFVQDRRECGHLADSDFSGTGAVWHLQWRDAARERREAAAGAPTIMRAASPAPSLDMPPFLVERHRLAAHRASRPGKQW